MTAEQLDVARGVLDSQMENFFGTVDKPNVSFQSQKVKLPFPKKCVVKIQEVNWENFFTSRRKVSNVFLA